MRRTDELPFDESFVSVGELSLRVLLRAVSRCHDEPPIVFCYVIKEAEEDAVVIEL